MPCPWTLSPDYYHTILQNSKKLPPASFPQTNLPRACDVTHINLRLAYLSFEMPKALAYIKMATFFLEVSKNHGLNLWGGSLGCTLPQGTNSGPLLLTAIRKSLWWLPWQPPPGPGESTSSSHDLLPNSYWGPVLKDTPDKLPRKDLSPWHIRGNPSIWWPPKHLDHHPVNHSHDYLYVCVLK